MLNILGKIDLSQFEKKKRPEISGERFDSFLSNYATKINQEFPEFLHSDASINFIHKDYDQAELRRDQTIVSGKEAYWSGGDLATWLKKKENNPSSIAEKAVSSLMVKFFGERFVIARASKFDDYENGIDNVLIDKETGAVVCGLDDVLGHEGDDGGDKKQEKMDKIYRKQGATLKYGATVVSGELKRKSFRYLPVFFLALSKEELGSLCSDFKDNIKSDVEYRVMEKLVNSLNEQHSDLDKANFHPELLKNLNSFNKLLTVMKDLIKRS
jgi:hypothetical protein